MLLQLSMDHSLVLHISTQTEDQEFHMHCPMALHCTVLLTEILTLCLPHSSRSVWSVMSWLQKLVSRLVNIKYCRYIVTATFPLSTMLCADTFEKTIKKVSPIPLKPIAWNFDMDLPVYCDGQSQTTLGGISLSCLTLITNIVFNRQEMSRNEVMGTAYSSTK